MDYQKLDLLLSGLYNNILDMIMEYSPILSWAILTIILWIFISIWAYKVILYLFKKFKLIQLIDKLTLEYSSEDEEKKENKKNSSIKKSKEKHIKLLSQKIKINIIVAKAISYYIFLVFFRFAIVIIWIGEIEDFMAELLKYLPKLFIAVAIWFFWIRFANFVYDVVYHALDLGKQKTAKIIASWAKVIILFFTLMVVLWKVWIENDITNTILTWFISMLAIAWWLAFWLGWKSIAKEILESFRK